MTEVELADRDGSTVLCATILRSMPHPDLADLATDPEARQHRLRAFRRNVEQDDAQMVSAWRERSAAEHGAAGAELSDMAARVAAQTGLAKEPGLAFPSLSSLRRRRREGGG